ncbi:MAG: 16S rRNA pseudouridine(516) synthase RsuA [Thiohalomonadaceae bacterium]
MRLDKFLCHATGLSRSRAQGVIRGGQVQVDGEPVRNPATAIAADAQVVFRDTPVGLTGKRYFMLHKPQGVVCATEDAQHRTVLDLMPDELPRGLHVAGRLDADTTGLVLISDDGDWTHRISSPKRDCAKVYRVSLAEPLDEDVATRFAEGIPLRNEDKPTRPAQLQVLSPTDVLLSLHEGRYHQVKRMFAAVGNRVIALHRQQIGALQLDPALAAGEYRALSDDEVALF